MGGLERHKGEYVPSADKVQSTHKRAKHLVTGYRNGQLPTVEPSPRPEALRR
jgi:hypothetical protein